jgi:acyl carrier protein
MELINGRQLPLKEKCRFREEYMKDKVKEVLANLLKVKIEELKDDVSLQNSIGVDSTEMVESVIALEKAFGVKLNVKEVTKNSTINDIANNIQSKLAK